MVTCGSCKGEGWKTIKMQSGARKDVDCEDCNGTGYVPKGA